MVRAIACAAWYAAIGPAWQTWSACWESYAPELERRYQAMPSASGPAYAAAGGHTASSAECPLPSAVLWTDPSQELAPLALWPNTPLYSSLLPRS